MMRRAMICLTTILILATMATAAFGQLSGRTQMDRSDRWEFSVQTRYTGSENYTGEGGSSLSLNDDLGWGFGFGYNIGQHFNLGMVMGWRSVPFEATAVLDDGSGETFKYSGSLDTSTFGATAEYYVLKGKFTPYVSGSIAWFNVNTNIFAGWTSGCWWDPWWGYVCGSVPLTYGISTSTYALGLGGRYDISDVVFARAGYEKGWVSDGTVDGHDIMRLDIGFLF